MREFLNFVLGEDAQDRRLSAAFPSVGQWGWKLQAWINRARRAQLLLWHAAISASSSPAGWSEAPRGHGHIRAILGRVNRSAGHFCCKPL
nr:hypothetical protein [uncultured Brevundimonas sp.]